MDSDTNATTSGEIGLASVLNILWRRRLIVVVLPVLGLVAGILYGQVVTPLYQATATIRPGITAFGRNGGGAREWRLKDLERWFESGMYRAWTAPRMDRAPSEVPLIRASFIQRGLQNTQRGEIITLSSLDASPENAMAGIDAAIEAFAEYALADTLSNSIALTERGLRIQIDELRRYQNVLTARVDSLDAELAVARVESLQIDDEAQRLAHDLSLLEGRRELMKQQVTSLDAQRAQIERDRDELAETRGRVRTRFQGATSEVPAGVKPSAALTDAEVLRGLVDTGAQLERRLVLVGARADSLRYAERAAAREAEYLRQRNVTLLELQRVSVGKRLRDTRRARDFGVPNALASVDLRIREKNGQLAALAPVERIGTVQVTDAPVRPRKKRAVTILTFLGFVGGIAGAFVFDYVWNNRRRIFQS